MRFGTFASASSAVRPGHRGSALTTWRTPVNAQRRNGAPSAFGTQPHVDDQGVERPYDRRPPAVQDHAPQAAKCDGHAAELRGNLLHVTNAIPPPARRRSDSCSHVRLAIPRSWRSFPVARTDVR